MVKNIFSIVVIISCCLFFSSCENNSNHLSGGYSFSANDNLSILPFPTIFDKGINRKITDYTFNEKFILVEQEPDLHHHIMMLSSSIRIRYSALKTIDSASVKLLPGQYEYYKQKLVEDSVLYRRMNKLGISSENSEKDRVFCENLADSIINKSPYYRGVFLRDVNYWIIAHRKPQEYFYLPSSDVFGPFSREEYLQKRKELGVPKELRLKTER
ncbi:MAG: hypothetical protein ACON4E_07510 [Flavobacteriales bacterium]